MFFNKRSKFLKTILFLAFIIIIVDHLAFYTILRSCTWPSIGEESNGTKVLLIADTHISNQHKWLDRVTRQWHARLAFQLSMFLHAPDIVIHLGDLLDYASFQSDAAFESDSTRFRDIFKIVSPQILFNAVAGNHDIGFHYSFQPHTYDRFSNAFLGCRASPAVKFSTYMGINLVFLNSMAFHSEEGHVYNPAVQSLKATTDLLQCIKSNSTPQVCRKLLTNVKSDSCMFSLDKESVHQTIFSRPILIQHFPLFRRNELICNPDLPEAMPSNLRSIPYKPSIDCMSERVTNAVMKMIRPRLVFGGHTHYGCHRMHTIPDEPQENLAEEWTVPSYSWRVTHQPGFAMLHVSSDKHAVTTCYLPTEIGLVYILCISFISVVLTPITCKSLAHRFVRIKQS